MCAICDRLVGKITHEDIDARIKCLQVVYPHGEDKLPWIVLATSDGTFQIWDFASFTLDDSSPEESNKSVEPMASTVLLTKPRVTCLSVVVASEKDGPGGAKSETAIQKAKKTKKATNKTPAVPAVGIPHVVVELGDEEKPEDEGDTSKKRKSGASSQQKNKNKKKKQKKLR